MAVAVAEAVELLMEEAVAVAERLTAAAVVEHRAAVAVAAAAEHHACKRHPHLVCKHLRACRLPRACKHPLV
jgi:hypothetical protein